MQVTLLAALRAASPRHGPQC